MTIYNFAAGLDGDIWVAICLEHDLVTQAGTLDELKSEAVALMNAAAEIDLEAGQSKATRHGPPPARDVADVEALPGACRFAVEVQG